MEWYSKLDEDALSDIILFDPITADGKSAMDRLGLKISDIDPDYFYNELRVGTNFGKPYEEVRFYEKDQEEFYLNRDKIAETERRFTKFERRMLSTVPNESPIILMGVAGNGKTIELHRMVDSVYMSVPDLPKPNKIMIDFDDYCPVDEMTFVHKHRNPYPTSVKWFFCWKLLKIVMDYIRSHKSSCTTIRANYYDYIINTTRFDSNYLELMELIGKFGNGKPNDIGSVYDKMYEFFGGENPDIDTAEERTREILKVLMLLMFCTNTEARNFILIDNIEHRIHINDSNIQVLDNDIVAIYRALKQATEDVINIFNDELGEDDVFYGWRKFKIIAAIRRTSLRLLDDHALQERNRRDVNIADFTGHFFIPDIWEKKKTVWNNYLKEKFVKIDPNADRKMALADLVLKEGTGIKGTSYQRLIARLMSHGIRRNAKAQAHAAIDMYNTLHSGKSSQMNYDDFERLRRENLVSLGHEAQYMIRRALIESQFKWAISDESSHRRWRDLGIGNPKYRDFGRNGEIADTVYDEKLKQWVVPIEYRDKTNVSLMRRVLSVLSYSRDFNDRGGIGSGVDLFYNVSLYKLVKAVLPGIIISSEEEYEKLIPLSRVLLSLCNMSNKVTKGAPFAILNINDPKCFDECGVDSLAEVITKVILAGRRASNNDGKYNSSDYGVRLTDAGYSFLITWQASFSFMASLYCHNTPSLFFLKDTERIEYVISTVYNSAHRLCKQYEKEAVTFCSKQHLSKQTFYTGLYLPEGKNGEKITFRERVKELHMEHLGLYKKYIQNYHAFIGISDKNADIIVEKVDMYLGLYKRWRVGKRTSISERITKVCF